MAGWRLWGLIGMVCLAAVAAGCEAGGTSQSADPPAQAPRRRTTKPRTAKVQRPQRKPVSPDAYGSITAAIAAMIAAADGGDSEERLQASRWLAMQGDRAVPPLAAILDTADGSRGSYIAACRVLGQIGPAGAEPLLRHVGSDNSILRLNAIDQLGVIKPTREAIVQGLAAQLTHDDPSTRLAVIRSLNYIGPPAKGAAPALQRVLNSNQDEVLRTKAKAALKRIADRRTLAD